MPDLDAYEKENGDVMNRGKQGAMCASFVKMGAVRRTAVQVVFLATLFTLTFLPLVTLRKGRNVPVYPNHVPDVGSVPIECSLTRPFNMSDALADSMTVGWYLTPCSGTCCYTAEIQWYTEPGVDYLCVGGSINASYLNGDLIAGQSLESFTYHFMYEDDPETTLAEVGRRCQQERELQERRHDE